MNSDEGQQRAANTSWSAAEMNLRAANMFQESVYKLETLLGQGYGSNLDKLIELLEKHGGTNQA